MVEIKSEFYMVLVQKYCGKVFFHGLSTDLSNHWKISKIAVMDRTKSFSAERYCRVKQFSWCFLNQSRYMGVDVDSANMVQAFHLTKHILIFQI